LVRGEDRDSIFSVTVARTQSISALKKAIKKENPEAFRGVDARSLHVWSVSIPVDPNFEENESKVDL
jgi:hypothetical protein